MILLLCYYVDEVEVYFIQTTLADEEVVGNCYDSIEKEQTKDGELVNL